MEDVTKREIIINFLKRFWKYPAIVLVVILVAWIIKGIHDAPEYVEPREQSYVLKMGKVFDGEHELRHLRYKETRESSFNGEASFFILSGAANISGQSVSKMEVFFSWRLSDGSYVISSLPIEKIRVRFDESRTIPSMVFCFKAKIDYCSREWDDEPINIKRAMKEEVFYATIACRERDWPTNIQMPDLGAIK